MADPESALQHPDVRRQYVDGESAFVILEHSRLLEEAFGQLFAGHDLLELAL